MSVSGKCGNPRRLLAVAVAGMALMPQAGMAIAGDVPWAETSGAVGLAEGLTEGRLSRDKLERLIGIGEKLFTAKFTVEEGAGRPNATQAILPTERRRPPQNAFARTSGLDANACSGCHNDPLPGGAGDFVTAVFVSEGFANADFDSTDPQFSNERGTNHLFGAGLLELLAREMSADLAGLRLQALEQARASGKPVRLELVTKGVSFGHITAQPDGLVDLSEIDGVDTDLVIRPFTQKGVMTSLRQFSVNAMNQHHGMQASERFGARWTGTSDHDGDGFANELSASDISALVAWQASRPAPVEASPDSDEWREAAAAGSAHFDEIGCASCHRRSLPLQSIVFADPGPFDVAGTLNSTQVKAPAKYDLELLEWTKKLERNEKGEILVPLFGDLKRHKMTDRRNEALGNELLPQRFVDRNIFQTAELWGVGSTAPYGHRNDFTTLDAIIRAHGGDAAESATHYSELEEEQRSALIAFLKTLRIEE